MFRKKSRIKTNIVEGESEKKQKRIIQFIISLRIKVDK